MFVLYTIYNPLYCPPFILFGLIKKNGYLTFISEIDLNNFNFNLNLEQNMKEINNVKWIHVPNTNTQYLNNVSFYLLDELLDKTQKNIDCIVDKKIQSYQFIDLPSEKPIITYVVLPKSQYDFSLKIGLLRSSVESFMGPYYYFHCYRPIIFEKTTHVVVKVALFLGKYHVIPKKDFNKKNKNLLKDYDYDTIYIFNPLTQTPYWVVKSHQQFQLIQ